MGGLFLDGRQVHASGLSQKAYRAAPCDVLLIVTPENQNEALAAFEEAGEFGKFRGLRVSGIADLSFLQRFPNLLYLEIVKQERVKTNHLEGLSNLRGLRLETPGAGIDFAWFPHLEVFSGDWHAENRNLALADELRRLRLWQFKPRSADLQELAHATRLEELHLTQTNITSLAGLETLEDLRDLEVAYAARLESLDALTTPGLGLREISFSKAKNIRSYEPLAALSHLRRLKLSSCASMPNLQWTRGMDRLDFFTFVETDVVDGNLSPLLELPRLRSVGTLDKRHYNMKCDALSQVLEQRYVQRTATNDKF